MRPRFIPWYFHPAQHEEHRPLRGTRGRTRHPASPPPVCLGGLGRQHKLPVTRSRGSIGRAYWAQNRSVGGSGTIFTGTRPGLTPSPGRWYAGDSSYSFPSLPLSPLRSWPRPAKWGVNLPAPLANSNKWLPRRAIGCSSGIKDSAYRALSVTRVTVVVFTY